ncbi:MAG TPA: glycosyltransferase, partial [Pyrinomonadaceae bacterium]|nr:glycosyltransferase [Pyrinomonadaceae bacterium]
GGEKPLATRKFCLALGRICPEKGFHFAIAAAERARTPLLLGGPVFSFNTYQKYFNEEIAPRCNGFARFIGPVNMQRKRRLLSAAKCILIPSVVPETSSLVAMEAFACGTPVVAFRSGALVEIVEHGRTGFLVNDEKEMADAIGEVASLDMRACLEAARERFSVERMVQQYFELYRTITTDYTKENRRFDPYYPRLSNWQSDCVRR